VSGGKENYCIFKEKHQEPGLTLSMEEAGEGGIPHIAPSEGDFKGGRKAKKK